MFETFFKKIEINLNLDNNFNHLVEHYHIFDLNKYYGFESNEWNFNKNDLNNFINLYRKNLLSLYSNNEVYIENFYNNSIYLYDYYMMYFYDLTKIKISTNFLFRNITYLHKIYNKYVFNFNLYNVYYFMRNDNLMIKKYIIYNIFTSYNLIFNYNSEQNDLLVDDIFLFDNEIFEDIFSRSNNFKGVSNFNFIIPHITLFSFFQKFFDYNLVLFNRLCTNNFNNNDLIVLKLSYIILFRYYRRYMRKFNLLNFITIVASSFQNKDLILLKNFISNKMRNINFKKHRHFLSFFKYVIYLIGNYFISNNFLKGIYIYISGKIGLYGSVKTRSWTYKVGPISLSSKKNKLRFEIFQIWTGTGCLGIRMAFIY